MKQWNNKEKQKKKKKKSYPWRDQLAKWHVKDERTKSWEQRVDCVAQKMKNRKDTHNKERAVHTTLTHHSHSHSLPQNQKSLFLHKHMHLIWFLCCFHDWSYHKTPTLVKCRRHIPYDVRSISLYIHAHTHPVNHASYQGTLLQ